MKVKQIILGFKSTNEIKFILENMNIQQAVAFIQKELKEIESVNDRVCKIHIE